MPVPQLKHQNVLDTIGKAEQVHGQRISNRFNKNLLDWQAEDRETKKAAAAMEAGLKLSEEGRAQQKHEKEMTEKDLDFLKTRVELTKQFLPAVRKETYPSFYQHAMQEWNLPKGTLLPPEKVAQMTPDQLEGYKQQFSMEADTLNEMTLEQLKAQLEKKQEQQKQTGRVSLEGVKQKDRLELEEEKQKGRLALEGVKQGGKVPGQVKEARQLISSIRGKVDTSTSQLLAGLMADFDADKAAKIGAKVPPELKDAYDAAIKVLNDYYGVKTQQEPAATSGGATHVFVPGQGLQVK